MLEQTLIAEHNRYEYEQAEEDRKFFLDYRADGVRKCSDAQREEADRAIERIDQVLPYRGFEEALTKNIFDRNVAFGQLFGLKADENGEIPLIEEKDTVMTAKECSIFDDSPYEELDMTPVEEPTKVTLPEQINKEVVAAKDLPDDDPYVECEGGFKYRDDYKPAKVTLAKEINELMDHLTMPAERVGNVCIVLNKRTHKIVYSNETEESVTITIERK
jgi:hypothetical protein